MLALQKYAATVKQENKLMFINNQLIGITINIVFISNYAACVYIYISSIHYILGRIGSMNNTRSYQVRDFTMTSYRMPLICDISQEINMSITNYNALFYWVLRPLQISIDVTFFYKCH